MLFFQYEMTCSQTYCLVILNGFACFNPILPFPVVFFSSGWTMLPLRSNPITGSSSLLRVAPPLCPASVLSHLWGFHLCFFLYIRATGSHVPHKSLYQAHAIFMPETIWPVIRFLPDLSQGNDYPLVLISFLRFRHFNNGSFAFVFLKHT